MGDSPHSRYRGFLSRRTQAGAGGCGDQRIGQFFVRLDVAGGQRGGLSLGFVGGLAVSGDLDGFFDQLGPGRAAAREAGPGKWRPDPVGTGCRESAGSGIQKKHPLV